MLHSWIMQHNHELMTCPLIDGLSHISTLLSKCICVTYPYNLLKWICKKIYSQINTAWVTLSHSFLSLTVFCNSPSTTNIHFHKSSSTMRITNCRNDNHYIFLPFRNSTSVVRIADCGTIWLFTISSAFHNVDCGL